MTRTRRRLRALSPALGWPQPAEALSDLGLLKSAFSPLRAGMWLLKLGVLSPQAEGSWGWLLRLGGGGLLGAGYADPRAGAGALLRTGCDPRAHPSHRSCASSSPPARSRSD